MNTSASGHVLIIDDEPTLRHTLARILQGVNLQVTTAANGADALALVRQQSFDLVYLDLRMPDLNGLEVLKQIHALAPETPVVLFTAQPDLHSALEAMRQGATDYLLKPLQPEDIVQRTQKILEKQWRERRKREIRAQIASLQAELKRLEEDDTNPTPPAPLTQSEPDRFFARGQFSLDLHARRLTLNGQHIALPPAAFDYLHVLMRHAPNVVDYQTLVTEAQGYQVGVREAQELAKWHIHQIRQAIEPDERTPRYLINVRGAGYRLVI